MSTLHTAMIFAAGRGERMRPLTDTVPKPLLEAGGKSLIVWQIEALAAAGIRRIVINHAWLGDAIEAALGDGTRWGVDIAYSREGAQALETAGGIARALDLLCKPIDAHGNADGHTVFLAVSGDVYTDFDYASLLPKAEALHAQDEPGLHLVMVPNPAYHPRGDFVLEGEQLMPDSGDRETDQMLNGDAKRLTFANIGLYDSRMFAPIAANNPIPRMALAPVFRQAIADQRATGECWHGRWANVGTPGDLAALDRELRAGN